MNTLTQDSIVASTTINVAIIESLDEVTQQRVFNNLQKRIDLLKTGQTGEATQKIGANLPLVINSLEMFHQTLYRMINRT